MSNLSDLQQLMSEITGISTEQLQTLYMPVGIYLQEAEDLLLAATPDLPALTARGLSTELFNSMPQRIGALREAQSRWAEKQNKQTEAIAIWKEEAPKAIEFRDTLLDELDFAYRKQPDLQAAVSEIAEGNTNADLVQDLNDLAVLGRNNPEPLLATNFNPDLLPQAAELSDTLAVVLADANGDRSATNDERVLRDQAYTYLKEAVDEVRSYGKFVFRNDAGKLKQYRSKFLRSRYLRNSNTAIN